MVFEQRAAGFGEHVEGADQSRLAGEDGQASGTDGVGGSGALGVGEEVSVEQVVQELADARRGQPPRVSGGPDLTLAEHSQVDQQVVQAGLLGVRPQERNPLAIDVYRVRRPFETFELELLRRRYQRAEKLHDLLGNFVAMDEEFYRRKLAVEDVDHGGQRQPGQMAGQLTVLSDEGFRGELTPRVVSGGNCFLGEGVEAPPYLRKYNWVGDATNYVLYELFLAGAARAGAAAEPDELLEVFDDEGVQSRAELHTSSSSAKAVSSAEREMTS